MNVNVSGDSCERRWGDKSNGAKWRRNEVHKSNFENSKLLDCNLRPFLQCWMAKCLFLYGDVSFLNGWYNMSEEREELNSSTLAISSAQPSAVYSWVLVPNVYSVYCSHHQLQTSSLCLPGPAKNHTSYFIVTENVLRTMTMAFTVVISLWICLLELVASFLSWRPHFSHMWMELLDHLICSILKIWSRK